MIWRGPAPYKDHLLCRTQEDLDGLLDEYRAKAEALVGASEWPMFDQLLVVCVDETKRKVVGVTSATGDDVLFLVVESRRGEGIGHLMVEALLPELGDVTEDEVLSEDWVPLYSAVAGSTDGVNFLHSLTSKFGWKAFALIEWSGFDEEKELWRIHRDDEKGRKRVLPPLRSNEDLLEVKIYEWPDGSDAILMIDNRHGQGDVFLMVRWIDLPPTWQDPTTGEADDPVFAIDSVETTGGGQWVTLDGAKRFPVGLERKMVGLFLDLGIKRPSQCSSLVSGSFGDVQVVRYPRFVPDERWEGRHEEARAWVGAETKDDLLDEVRFFYLYRGRWEVEMFPGRRALTARGDDGWTATWGANESSSTWNATLEGAVDEALSRELVLPESQRAAWEAEHVERGTLILPTPDEVEIFRLLGEALPFWWPTERLVEWLRSRP